MQFQPKKLQELRQNLNLSRERLVRQAGLKVTAQSVFNWEHKIYKPDVDSLAKICETFDLPVAYFFS